MAQVIEDNGDFAAVFFGGFAVAAVDVAIAEGELREFFLEEGEEGLPRSGHEIKDAAAEPLRAGVASLAGERIEIGAAIRHVRNHGHDEDADGDSGFAQLADGFEAQNRVRRARFEHASEARAHGGDRHIDGNRRALSDALEQVNIAHDAIRFRGDREAEAFAFGHFFEDGARGAKFLFGRLIWIGGGSDGDVFAPGLARGEVARNERTGILFDENLLFEFVAIQLHEFVRIAGVAIAAAEFAAAIGVDRPVERDVLGFAMIQDRANRQKEILRAALGLRARGGSGETRNADQFRGMLCFRGGDGRKGRSSIAAGLTVAGASGRGESEAGLFRRTAPVAPKRRRWSAEDGRSGHCASRR